MNRISHWIDGKVSVSTSGRSGVVFDPATGEQQASVDFASVAEVDHAIAVAKAAFPAWRATNLSRRAEVMFHMRELVAANRKEIASLLSKEHGKVLGDALGEVARGLENVEFACGIPQLLKGGYSEQASSGVDVYNIRQPLGVVAGITPFNFPAMVPMWMFANALACGNTMVLKPSEKDPSASMFLAELLKQAGLPDGVFNVLHGDKVAVDRLLEHPDIQAISFVGSTPVAKYIYASAAAEGKRVQALGGAKNHLVVMPDADLPKTVEAIIGSAFGAAGERCLAGSVLVCVGDVAEPLLDLLIERVRNMNVGDGSRQGTDMGPLITAEHAGRVAGHIQRGIADGAVPLADGRSLRTSLGSYFVGPTILDHANPDMSVACDEIFGPVLTVLRVKTLDEAIQLVNRSRFGNASSIFTDSGSASREYTSRVEAGMVGVNIGVAAPMAFFPFAGWKQSFFGDLHAHGKDAVSFYTEQKVIMSRWF